MEVLDSSDSNSEEEEGKKIGSVLKEAEGFSMEWAQENHPDLYERLWNADLSLRIILSKIEDGKGLLEQAIDVGAEYEMLLLHIYTLYRENVEYA